MSDRATRMLERLERLKSDRQNWDSHFESLARVFLPRRLGFTSVRPEGERRTEELYDGTPQQAARGLAGALDGLLKPKTEAWVRTRVVDDALDNEEEVKDWLAFVDDRMLKAIYNPRARFQQASGEVDHDLAVLGTGALFIGEAQNLDRLTFASQSLAGLYLMVDADGMVNALYRTRRFTARQAQEFFVDRLGGTLGKTAGKAIEDKMPDKKLDYVHAVLPRREREGTRKDNRNLPFASIWIDVDDKTILHESGFHEFPFAVPRWDTLSGELYGRSPAMIALPDANTLQAQGETILMAGEYATLPPIFAPSDSIVGPSKLRPGRYTFYDLDAAVGQRLAQPIFPMQTGASIPIGREMQNDTRDQVWAAFFRNVLNLPNAGPQMTATEIIQRKEEFVRTIGPVFGRLESDYLAPIVERVFGIMLRAGSFGEMPEMLAGADMRFEFRSPIERVRKQIEAAAALKSVEEIGLVAQATGDPGVLDFVDRDKVAKLIDEANGANILRSDREVAEMRQQRAQAEQAAAQAADAEKALTVGADVIEKAGLLDQVPG
ncbi:MAG: hypothetical protein GKS00_21970 [Alphaproteobacteria bacterium]|nr:hypothetical protein [Alphaproteobacteria bacterium]